VIIESLLQMEVQTRRLQKVTLHLMGQLLL